MREWCRQSHVKWYCRYRSVLDLDIRIETGVIAPVPDAYATSRSFSRMLGASDEARGIGLAAKYF